MKNAPGRKTEYALKRAFDAGTAALGLAVLSPLLLGISAAIRCTSPGPVLYRQERVGLNGKVFTMLKFRSMEDGAEETSAWTARNDPRRTGVGVWLRRYSLDELPQLVNVLCGSMSLVGPRPEQPSFAESFQQTIPGYVQRYRMRPGITGWAQVNGLRGDTSIEERAAHDLWYIENWTPWLDVRILVKTLCGGMINRLEFPDRGERA
ncbi:MAG: exopolysaccharide biosynthesis polyprenyl glycosylphosphotransferase [Oscillospiraceae bacterium]|nr:exopolysaccharide biosynthesis polyprenyl glycosylphosphotransferase [Oscillospiraceae bacterium]